MKIYVGNLDARATGEELRGLFEPFGAVSGAAVHVVGSGAFGRVEMPDADERRRAIDGVSGLEHRGRRLVVAECSDEPASSR